MPELLKVDKQEAKSSFPSHNHLLRHFLEQGNHLHSSSEIFYGCFERLVQSNLNARTRKNTSFTGAPTQAQTRRRKTGQHVKVVVASSLETQRQQEPLGAIRRKEDHPLPTLFYRSQVRRGPRSQQAEQQPLAPSRPRHPGQNGGFPAGPQPNATRRGRG